MDEQELYSESYQRVYQYLMRYSSRKQGQHRTPVDDYTFTGEDDLAHPVEWISSILRYYTVSTCTIYQGVR